MNPQLALFLQHAIAIYMILIFISSSPISPPHCHPPLTPPSLPLFPVPSPSPSFPQVYYYNARTRESVWTKPEGVKVIQQAELNPLMVGQPGGGGGPTGGGPTASAASASPASSQAPSPSRTHTSSPDTSSTTSVSIASECEANTLFCVY